MRQNVKWRRFHELDTTAKDEFDRLLRGGGTQLDPLPFQHKATVTEALYALAIDPGSYPLGFEVALYPGRGGALNELYWVIRWDGDAELLYANGLDDEAISLLKLYSIIQLLERTEPERAARPWPFAASLAVHQEVVRLFWRAFVVPELHAEGVTLKQSERRARTNYPDDAGADGPTKTETVRGYAEDLRRRGLERSEASRRLQSRFGFGRSRANKILVDIGWRARAPRSVASPARR